MLVLKFLMFIHFLIWARPPSQAFFFYITLKRTLCHEKWYQFHFSTMICVGMTTSVMFFCPQLYIGYPCGKMGKTVLHTQEQSCKWWILDFTKMANSVAFAQIPQQQWIFHSCWKNLYMPQEGVLRCNTIFSDIF